MTNLQDAAARMYAAKKFKDKATKKATEGLDEKETVQVETETMMDKDKDILDSLKLLPFHDLDGNKIG